MEGNTIYPGVLQQQVKDLEQELNITKEDRDTKEKMLINMESCLIDIYQNANGFDDALEKIAKCLHNAVIDAFPKQN